MRNAGETFPFVIPLFLSSFLSFLVIDKATDLRRHTQKVFYCV